MNKQRTAEAARGGRFCKRACQICATDLRRKKVGAGYDKRVICLACHARGWTYTGDGQAINYKDEAGDR